MRSVGIIGGGVGGLALAALLAERAYAVAVYERGELGGKLGRVEVAGQRVDTGPSLFTFPGVWRTLLGRLGAPDPLELRPLPGLGLHVLPHTRFELPVPAGHELHAEWRRYLREVAPLEAAVEALLTTPPRLGDARFRAASLRVGRALLPHGSTRAWLRSRRYPPALRRALAVHALNAGVGPRAGSSLYALLPGLTATSVWRPRNGMFALVEALVALGSRRGVQYHAHTPVRRVQPGLGAVQLEDRTVRHDLLVSAVDPTRLMTLLGRPSPNARLSVSGVAMYGVPERELPLPATVVIPPTDLGAFERSVAAGQPPPDTLALLHYEREPRVLSVLLTAPPGAQDWDADHPWVRGQIERAERLLGVELTAALSGGVTLSPAYFAAGGATGGAIYGRVFPWWRSGPFHPERYRLGGQLWQVGSGVHPGGGLPAVLGSALIVDELLAREHAGQ